MFYDGTPGKHTAAGSDWRWSQFGRTLWRWDHHSDSLRKRCLALGATARQDYPPLHRNATGYTLSQLSASEPMV